MRLISHRGNINGRSPSRENHPKYIDIAITQGYDVEVDVWLINGKYFLGHDQPTFKIDESWIAERSGVLWCHAKNLAALQSLSDPDRRIRVFWHEDDRFTLTSNNVIWTNIGEGVCGASVLVALELKDLTQIPNAEIYGICSDYVGLLK